MGQRIVVDLAEPHDGKRLRVVVMVRLGRAGPALAAGARHQPPRGYGVMDGLAGAVAGPGFRVPSSLLALPGAVRWGVGVGAAGSSPRGWRVRIPYAW